MIIYATGVIQDETTCSWFSNVVFSVAVVNMVSTLIWYYHE